MKNTLMLLAYPEPHMVIMLTFDDLLGAGLVDLILVRVRRQDSVEHVRLPLKDTKRKRHHAKHTGNHTKTHKYTNGGQ